MSKIRLLELGQDPWEPDVAAAQAEVDAVEVDVADHESRITTLEAGSIVSGLDINKKKATPDPPDDDFDVGSALDTAGTRHAGATPWVVTAGAAGTIGDITQTDTSGAIFQQLDPENLLVARIGKSVGVRLRLDYTLPDGASIIAALAPSVHSDAVLANNESRVGVAVNASDTSYTTGDHAFIGLDTDTNEVSLKTITNSGNTVAQAEPRGNITYLRIARSGLAYFPYYSFNGLVWVPGSGVSTSSAFDNIWLIVESSASFTGRAIIVPVLWIRQGTNALFPWDIVT